MLEWLSLHGGTILICLVLLLVIAAILFSLRRDRKKGRSFCGGNCGHCPMGGSCHRR